jgi:isopenicillin N synthase-like dioxygenase
MPLDRIPLIDFAPFMSGSGAGKQQVAGAIRDACEQVGFLYLGNHGVPQAKIDAVFAAAREFFALPEARKMDPAIRVTPQRTRGYQPLFARHYAHTDAPDVNEAFKYQHDYPADDPDIRAGNRFHQANQWPSGLPGWRETLLDYFDEMEKLSDRLLRAFALALDLDEAWFLEFYRKPLTQVTLLHYPPQPRQAPERQYGIRPHADATAFTVLAQDEVGGLQVQGRDGWVDAPPIPGTYVINIGDMMARWTNDRFKSTPHRVINLTGRERYSVPYFAIPDFDAVVACLPSCRSADNPPKYPPLHVGEAITRKFATDWRREDARTA